MLRVVTYDPITDDDWSLNWIGELDIENNIQFLMQAFKIFKNRNDMFENSFKIQVQYFTQKFHPKILPQKFDPDILNLNFDELFYYS